MRIHNWTLLHIKNPIPLGNFRKNTRVSYTVGNLRLIKNNNENRTENSFRLHSRRDSRS